MVHPLLSAVVLTDKLSGYLSLPPCRGYVPVSSAAVVMAGCRISVEIKRVTESLVSAVLAHLVSLDWGCSGCAQVKISWSELRKAVLLHRGHGWEVPMAKVNSGSLSYHPRRTFLFWDLSFTYLCKPKRTIGVGQGGVKLGATFSHRLHDSMVESQGSFILFYIQSFTSESFQGGMCLLQLAPWQTPGYSVLQVVVELQLFSILMKW